LLVKTKSQNPSLLNAALPWQLSSSDDSEEISEQPPSKKPRIQLEPNDSILQELTVSEHFEKGEEESLLPWLQIVERILFKYPKVAGETSNLGFTLSIFERVVTLLQIVQTLEVKELSLRCAHLIIVVSKSSEECKGQLQKAIGEKKFQSAVCILMLSSKYLSF
jgi:hypothetical protein